MLQVFMLAELIALMTRGQGSLHGNADHINQHTDTNTRMQTHMVLPMAMGTQPPTALLRIHPSYHNSGTPWTEMVSLNSCAWWVLLVHHLHTHLHIHLHTHKAKAPHMSNQHLGPLPHSARIKGCNLYGYCSLNSPSVLGIQ